MRILVDLADTQIKELDALAAKDQRSRASVLREAVDAYISDKKNSLPKTDGFGLWKGRDVDGLAYQEKLRGEW
jgi:metal-responsive CopG/Arc/MetJ family transcriptional regulator